MAKQIITAEFLSTGCPILALLSILQIRMKKKKEKKKHKDKRWNTEDRGCSNILPQDDLKCLV